MNNLAWLFLILIDSLLFMFPNCFMYKGHLILDHCSVLWPSNCCCSEQFDFLNTTLCFLRHKFSFSEGGEWIRIYVLAYSTYFTLPNLKRKPEEEKKMICTWKACRLMKPLSFRYATKKTKTQTPKSYNEIISISDSSLIFSEISFMREVVFIISWGRHP